MSNSFYQKDLTDTQRNKIKFLFEKSKKDARRLRIFATLLLVSTNCPPAFSILSYLPLLPFTFNLPTALGTKIFYYALRIAFRRAGKNSRRQNIFSREGFNLIVSWNTTNACNMYCAHCYRDAGCKAEEELSTAEAKELLNQIARAGFKIMIFSGGEPLMRPDILELVEHATNLKLIAVFGTNGTLITRQMAKDLKSAGAKGMGISLDSLDAEKHDKFRSFAGAWQGAVDGMKNCLAENLPFQIHTTVMDWNQHELEALTDFAVEIGAKAHHFFFLVPTGRAKTIEEESLRAEGYENVLTRIMRKQQEVSIELKPTCAPQFLRIADQLGMKLRFKRGCLAGLSYCIISPRGKVQPCAYLNMELGDVREIPFDELWRSNKILKTLRTLEYSGNCGGCKYKNKCGGCRARAACYNGGDFMSGEPWCNFNRH